MSTTRKRTKAPKRRTRSARSARAATAAPAAAVEPRFGYGTPVDTRVEFFCAYDDASGVGCRISWGGHLFSFDVRGAVRHTLLRAEPSASSWTRQIALELCTLTFLKLLASSVDVAWREKNML